MSLTIAAPEPAIRRRLCRAALGLVPALVLAHCAGRPEAVADRTTASALLREARAVTQEQGLPAARDLVTRRLRAEDASGGSLEERVLRTTRDPELVLPDSLAAMTPAERRRVALVIVPGTKSGFGAKSNLTQDCLFAAAEEGRRLGFDTHFIQTAPRGTVESNAELVAERIRPIFARADRVALVMLSKGAHDVIHYLQEHAVELPADCREKLVAVLSLAGTVQGSVVADWFANSTDPAAMTTRGWLMLSGQGESIGMLRTVARSPWRKEVAGSLREAFPRLTWVSVAMVPDGPDGQITERLWAPKIRARVRRSSPYYSPNDGLVESAASVLPDAVAVPEWIVLAQGSHSMPNGRYLDGTRVAPRTTVPGVEDLAPASGGEVMSAYLRALPRSLLR